MTGSMMLARNAGRSCPELTKYVSDAPIPPPSHGSSASNCTITTFSQNHFEHQQSTVPVVHGLAENQEKAIV